MNNLKPCPFCGSDAKIVSVVICRGSNRTGEFTEGAVCVNTKSTWDGRKIYFWERYGFTVQCTKSKCICRNVNTKFKTVEEATEVWNKRMDSNNN